MGAYNDKVLFIHIPKAAGWSVKKYMGQVLPGVLMPNNPASKLPLGHVRLQDIERFTGRSPAGFELIFAVVRNPYEQQLSQWQFWRDRYAKGDRHEHDAIAVSHPTLTEFLEDPRCDFHVWYAQHYGYEEGMSPAKQKAAREICETKERYEDFGGLFKYWLTVDGEIPDNVKVLRAEELGEALPEVLRPCVGIQAWCGQPEREAYKSTAPLPPVPTLNTSPHGKNTKAYYTPRAAQLVEQKAEWCFENYYEKWLYSSFGGRPTP